MLAIGLRNRFILTTTLVLLVTVFAVSFFQHKLLEMERFRLVDRSIEASMALVLLSDPLVEDTLTNIDDVDRVISEILGEDKLSQFVIVSNNRGQIVYKSHKVDNLDLHIDPRQQWQTISLNGTLIRVLTVPDAKNLYNLSLGQILTSEEITWKKEARIFWWIGLITAAIGILAAILITRLNLTPLRELSRYLKHLSDTENTHLESKVLKEIQSHKDELSELAQSILNLTQHLQNQKKNQIQLMYQMAHEIKTPLTILSNGIYQLRIALTEYHGSQIPLKVETEILTLQKETQELNELVSTFLDWSQSSANPFKDDDLFAIDIQQALQQAIGLFPIPDQKRILLRADNNALKKVFANQNLLQQMITNLLSNALKYTSGTIEVELGKTFLKISDHGPGIPSLVEKHLGEPFNRGQNSLKGHGLGLAWVYTICQKYDWKFTIQRPEDAQKASVQIQFEYE